MTKTQASKLADPLVIAQMFAINYSEATEAPLARFIRRNNKLPKEVINMMIIFIIAVNNQKLPIQESYYRKVQEDWLNRNIITGESAIKYFSECMDIASNIQKYNEQGTNEKGLESSLKPKVIPKQIPLDPEVDRALDDLFLKMR